jgi:hypothetical protein
MTSNFELVNWGQARQHRGGNVGKPSVQGVTLKSGGSQFSNFETAA